MKIENIEIKWLGHSGFLIKSSQVMYIDPYNIKENSEKAELLKVTSLDFSETDELIQEIKADYDFIQHKLITKGFKSLTGKDGKWIQARTKGPGHGSVSRAFYARTSFVKKIFEIAS